MTQQFRAVLLVEVPDYVLVDAVEEAERFVPVEPMDKQEFQLYRLLTVKYVYAGWMQLQRFTGKRELIRFIYSAIERLRGLQKWPDWNMPASSTVDRRTREPVTETFGAMISATGGSENRRYYPNPERLTVEEAGRITATLLNLGVKTEPEALEKNNDAKEAR